MRRFIMRRAVSCAVAVAASCFVVSCDQQPAAPLSNLKPTAPSGVLLYDSGIDPANTTVTADITQQTRTTINSAQPLLDPRTGQSVTSLVISPHAGSFHMELGYDYYNRVRTNQYLPDTAYNSRRTLAADTKIVRLANQALTEYDAANGVLPVVLPTTSVTRSPIAPLGAFNYRSITSGLFVDTSVTGGITTRPDRAPLPSGTHLTMRRGGGQLEVTVESHDAAPHARFDPRPSTRSVGAQASDGGVRQHGKVHRTIKTYDRRDGIYVLHEVRDEVDEISGGRATTQVSVMTLTNLTWHINKQKDAERERLLALALAAPASSSPASIGLVKPSGPSAVIVCDPSVDPSCGGGGSPPPPPPPTGPAQNIVFQHGILSNAGTWDRMDPWLSSTFFFGKKVKLSLPSLQHIDV